MIPNAGFQHVSSVEEFDEDRWDALVALLLTSPFLLSRYARPALRASGNGRIVVLTSVHGLVASPFKAGYVSAKHGVLGLVKTLALEGASQGIRASAVCPWYVRTPLVEAQVADQARVHGIPEDRVLEEVLLAPQALKRMLDPSEVADAWPSSSGRRTRVHHCAARDGRRLDGTLTTGREPGASELSPGRGRRSARP